MARSILNVLSLITIAAPLISCDNGDFKASDASVNAPAKPSPTPDADVKKKTKKIDLKNNIFHNFRPVLAVRQPACLSCHAQIKGDLVSDFMLGTSAYVGASSFSGPSLSHRFQGPSAFKPDFYQNLNIDGKFMIPKATISDDVVASRVLTLDSPVSITSILTSPFDNPVFSNSDTISSSSQANLISNLGAARNKSNPGVNEIKEMSKVKIAVPDEDELKALIKSSKAKVVAEQGAVAIYKAGKGTVISGLQIKQGSSTKFVMNGNQVACHGDVIIKGTLVLKNLVVDTDGKSCRLYVIGSIFIQGALTYASQQMTSSLQIVASRPIFVGIRNIEERVDAGDLYSRYYNKADVLAEKQNVASHIFDDAGPYFIAWTNDIDTPIAKSYVPLNEIHSGSSTVNLNSGKWVSIGGNSLARTCGYNGDAIKGAGDGLLPGQTCAVGRNRNYQRKSVDYNHVVFVTPAFHNRYKGNLTGAVVAEIAVFSLGDLGFHYDQLFKNADVFPLLDRAVLSVK